MPTSLPTGVRLRGSVYHLRIGIPDDIRHLWPRREDGSLAVDAYRASLKTSDRNEAAARAHAIIAEYRRKFEDIRSGARPATPTPITDELIAYIVQRVERYVLAGDDTLRSNPRILRGVIERNAPPGWLTGRPLVDEAWDAVGDFLDPAQYESAAQIRVARLHQLRTDLMLGRLDAAREPAQEACAALSITVDWGQPKARAGLQAILRAMVRAYQNVEKRDAGEPVETPVEPEKPKAVAAPVKPVTLRDVIPNWLTRNTPKQDAIGRTNRSVALFEQVVGTKPLSELTKADGAAFVRFLLDPERKIVRKTAGNVASAITALLSVAVKDDMLASNPLDLSFDKTAGSQRREPWTDAELNLILSSPLLSSEMDSLPRWQNVEPEDGRAVLLLLLHSGARIGEVAQLRREDFVVRNGVHAVRFTAEAGSLKNAESERTVPLAQHVLNDPWFSAWLAKTMGGSGYAFPSLNGRANPSGDIAGRWFLKFRQVTGLPPGKLKGSHRFRHSLRTWLAEVGVNTETADAITGHAATGSSGRRVYTAQASLPAMKEALDKVKWPEAA